MRGPSDDAHPLLPGMGAVQSHCPETAGTRVGPRPWESPLEGRAGASHTSGRNHRSSLRSRAPVPTLSLRQPAGAVQRPGAGTRCAPAGLEGSPGASARQSRPARLGLRPRR